jgi:nitrous oxidase accessory protein NosD
LINDVFGVQVYEKDCAVQDCFIIGTGTERVGTGVHLFDRASGVLVKGNQVSQFIVAITHNGGSGSAFTSNYIANSTYGLALSSHDFHQGNVVTSCTVPFTGGNAIRDGERW